MSFLATEHTDVPVDLMRLRRPAIFLAGPTPRGAHPLSWRPEAVALFHGQGFQGTVIVPEPFGGPTGRWPGHDTQLEREYTLLEAADIIMFWIPRSLPLMAGLRTNVEWGYWMQSRKVVAGIPRNAEKCEGLRYDARKFSIPLYETLEDTVSAAILRAAGRP